MGWAGRGASGDEGRHSAGTMREGGGEAPLGEGGFRGVQREETGSSKRRRVLGVGDASGPCQASQGSGWHSGDGGWGGLRNWGTSVCHRHCAGSCSRPEGHRLDRDDESEPAFTPKRTLLGSQLVAREEDDGKGDGRGSNPPHASGAEMCEEERSRGRRKCLTAHR